MLVFVKPVFFLCFAHAHPGLDIDIVIDPVHIRKSMMDHIVFHVPHEAVTSQYIERKSGKMIYPFVFGETAMRPVMHHIESDGCDHASQEHAFQYGPKSAGGKKNEVDVYQHETHHQYHRLDKKVVIPRGRLAHLLKIITDPGFQLSVKRMGYVGKFGH